MAAHEEVWTLLGERSIESLVELPRMTDPDIEAGDGRPGRALPPGLSSLTTTCSCSPVPDGLAQPAPRQAAASVLGLAWFGDVPGPLFKRYREGLGTWCCSPRARRALRAWPPARGSAL